MRDMYISLVIVGRRVSRFPFLVAVSQHGTYLGRIEDPLEIRIICKCPLNYFNGTGDIRLGKRYDLNSHDYRLWSLHGG
jgi:hypothetical protein